MNLWGKILGRVSIRIFFPVVAALSIALLLATCFLGYSLKTNYDRAALAAHQNAQIKNVVYELRQSANDMTRLARLFAKTGDEIYRNNYQVVEDILNGRQARPQNYEHIYWELLPNVREERHPSATAKSDSANSSKVPESLILRWQKLPLPESEKQLLQNSFNSLHQQRIIEEAVFVQMDVTEENTEDRIVAVQSLFDERYQRAKHNIMLPLDVLLMSLQVRHQKEIETLQHETDNIVKVFVGVLVVFVLLMGLIILFVRIKVLTPLRHMTGNIRQAHEGREIERRIFYPDEIGLLMQQFYSMKEQMDRSFQELETVSFTDSLTGLYNRYYFNQVAKRQMLLAVRNNQVMCLLICDIDHFKSINDKYGHLAGDIALKHVASVVLGCVRESDICARFGGEEFLLLLPNVDVESGVVVAEKIRSLLEETPCDIGHDTFLNMTISIGITDMHGTDNIRDAIDWADRALYKAKNGGRNQVCRAE